MWLDSFEIRLASELRLDIGKVAVVAPVGGIGAVIAERMYS